MTPRDMRMWRVTASENTTALDVTFFGNLLELSTVGLARSSRTRWMEVPHLRRMPPFCLLKFIAVTERRSFQSGGFTPTFGPMDRPVEWQIE